MNLRLVRPGPEHERAVTDYLAEFRASGENHVNGSGGLHRYGSYAEWLISLGKTEPGGVKQTTFLSYHGEELIGSIAVRHALNEETARKGGHIGYSIRPSRRRMGYGKAQLRLALDECARLGITHALITCEEKNAASAATIAAFDGVEDRPCIDDGAVIRRFWVATGAPDYAAVNSETWDRWAEGGIEWSVPIAHEEYARAKAGDWGVYLTPMRHVPRAWFPKMRGAKVLLLAGGGGQQGPVFAALGAEVTVFDNAARQLATEKEVAEREGYEIRLVKGDMTKRLPFEDGAFDLVFHPVSNCYVENVYHVWRECYRVLKKGGVLLAGMDNNLSFLIGDDLHVKSKLPFNPLRDPEVAAPGEGLQFSHTLAEQIGGQLRAGFRLTDIFDDYDRPGGSALGAYTPLYFATRAVKE